MSSKKTLNENFDSLGIKKLLLIAAAAAIGLFLLIFSILNSIQNTQILVDPSSSSSPSSASSSLRVLNLSSDPDKVDIVTQSGKHTFKVALATTPESRSRGLMDITSMESDQGMLFIFPESLMLSFWMKNTYIPLDIIFIDENFEIIKIHENTLPLNEIIQYPSEQPAKYVLEINAKISKEKGIRPGDKVELEISR